MRDFAKIVIYRMVTGFLVKVGFEIALQRPSEHDRLFTFLQMAVAMQFQIQL